MSESEKGCVQLVESYEQAFRCKDSKLLSEKPELDPRLVSGLGLAVYQCLADTFPLGSLL